MCAKDLPHRQPQCARIILCVIVCLCVSASKRASERDYCVIGSVPEPPVDTVSQYRLTPDHEKHHNSDNHKQDTDLVESNKNGIIYYYYYFLFFSVVEDGLVESGVSHGATRRRRRRGVSVDHTDGNGLDYPDTIVVHCHPIRILSVVIMDANNNNNNNNNNN